MFIGMNNLYNEVDDIQSQDEFSFSEEFSKTQKHYEHPKLVQTQGVSRHLITLILIKISL